MMNDSDNFGVIDGIWDQGFTLEAFISDVPVPNPDGGAVLFAQMTTHFGLITTGSGGQGDTVYRLREGIERFLITDINNPGASAKAQSEVPLMFDNSGGGDPNADLFGGDSSNARFNHIPGGSNVLYLDGHVKFVKKWQVATPLPAPPATEEKNSAGEFPITQWISHAQTFHVGGGQPLDWTIVP